MQKKIKIAGHVFLIESIYDTVLTLSRDYLTDEPAEFFIRTAQEDIETEKAMTAKESALENVPLIEFPDDSYELTAVYRKIVESLFPFDILLFHGSTVAVDAQAYMFIAKSGTGKSTHTRLWRELLGERAVMVNDDKPLVQISETETTVYGTPWSGKHHLNSNIAVPLRGICIVKRGADNRIREISPAEAYPMLLQQTHRMPGKDDLKKTMTLIDRMSRHMLFYTMDCTISTAAAEMAYQTMHGDERKKKEDKGERK